MGNGCCRTGRVDCHASSGRAPIARSGTSTVDRTIGVTTSLRLLLRTRVKVVSPAHHRSSSSPTDSYLSAPLRPGHSQKCPASVRVPFTPSSPAFLFPLALALSFAHQSGDNERSTKKGQQRDNPHNFVTSYGRANNGTRTLQPTHPHPHTDARAPTAMQTVSTSGGDPSFVGGLGGVSPTTNGGGGFECTLQLRFPSADAAAVAVSVLQVESPFSGTTRRLGVAPGVDRAILVAVFAAASRRDLRGAVHSFAEQLDLVLCTLEAFGHTAVQKSSSRLSVPVVPVPPTASSP